MRVKICSCEKCFWGKTGRPWGVEEPAAVTADTCGGSGLWCQSGKAEALCAIPDRLRLFIVALSGQMEYDHVFKDSSKVRSNWCEI